MMISTLSLPLWFIAAASPGGDGGGGNIMNLVFMAAMMYLVFWWLIFRPQRKQQAEQQRLLDELKKGDRVQTNAGILGTIHKIDKENDQVIIIVDPSQNVKLTIVRSSVASVANPEVGAAVNKNSKNEKVETAS